MRRDVLIVERDGLAQLVFAGGSGGGIAALEKAERGVEVGAVRVDRERLLDLRERFRAISFGGGDRGEQSVGVGIIRESMARTALACSAARSVCLPATSRLPRSMRA